MHYVCFLPHFEATIKSEYSHSLESLFSFCAQTANQISSKHFSCFLFACNSFIWSTPTCFRIMFRCSPLLIHILLCKDWISLFSIWNSKRNLIVLYLCLVWYSTNIGFVVKDDEVKMSDDHAATLSLYVNNVLH